MRLGRSDTIRRQLEKGPATVDELAVLINQPPRSKEWVKRGISGLIRIRQVKTVGRFKNDDGYTSTIYTLTQAGRRALTESIPWMKRREEYLREAGRRNPICNPEHTALLSETAGRNR